MILFNQTSNDFLRKIYFDSLISYRKDIGVVNSLKDVKNEVVLLDAEHLKPDMIVQLKNDHNTLIAFDINDHSSFCYSYYGSSQILDVDMIFKVAGLQKINHDLDVGISNSCEYTIKTKPFMDDTNWEYYKTLLSEGRIHSLPYVLWENYDVPNISFTERKNKVLVRGGHHYLRVHLLFNLIRYGLVDENSSFNTRGYIGQYCKGCSDIYKKGRMTLDSVKNSDLPCKIPSELPDSYFQDRGDWNNNCPSRYFEMAELMGIDRGMVENVLNGNYVKMFDFYNILNKYTMYADLKWIFSIYVPPRFWEAATAHTVNLVPLRTMGQDYFPEMEEGEHYIAYSEEFDDLDLVCDLSESEYKYIADNAYDLYDKWIKRNGSYMLSTNLMDHIMRKIEGANCGI